MDFINEKYGDGTACAEIKDQYYNMREQVEPHMRIVDIAKKAIEMAGVKPKVQPIRGGTDGANLSFRGPRWSSSQFLRWRKPLKSS